MTILIADANEAFAAELVHMFAVREGTQVVAVATDGEDALTLLKKHQPDTMVLDLMLPRRDGLDVLKWSQKMKKPPVVLAVSAFISDFVVNMALTLGARYLMTKPCAVEAVAERLQQMTAQPFAAVAETGDFRLAEYERQADEALCACRIQAGRKGFEYLRMAVALCLEKPDRIYAITKEIYPVIAARKRIQVELVERNMRSAIERNWNQGGSEALTEYLGYRLPSGGDRPSNASFIAMLVERLRCQQDSLDVGPYKRAL